MPRSQWAGGPHTGMAASTPFVLLGKLVRDIWDPIPCRVAVKMYVHWARSAIVSRGNSSSLVPMHHKMQGRRFSDDGFAGRSTFKHNTTGLSGDCICKVQQDEQTTVVTEITWALHQEELCCTNASATPTHPCCIGVKEKKKKKDENGRHHDPCVNLEVKFQRSTLIGHDCRKTMQACCCFSSSCAVKRNAATRIRQVAAQRSHTDRQERKWRWHSLLPSVQTNQVTCGTVQVKQFAKVALELGRKHDHRKCTQQALKGNSTAEPRYNEAEWEPKIRHVQVVIFACGRAFFDMVQQSL